MQIIIPQTNTYKKKKKPKKESCVSAEGLLRHWVTFSYRPKFAASSNVSGSLRPRVSGSSNENIPAVTAMPPNTMRGSARPKLPSTYSACYKHVGGSDEQLRKMAMNIRRRNMQNHRLQPPIQIQKRHHSRIHTLTHMRVHAQADTH